MNIGIYGGSFNPIHNGHLALARQFLRQLSLNEVWFVVSPQNPFKVNHTLLSDHQRLSLVEKALQAEPKLRASDVEFRLPKPSYMWNTLQSLSARYPDHAFTLLIGGDNWERFDQWYHADDILRHYRIAVYPRIEEQTGTSDAPVAAHPLLSANAEVCFLHAELLHISSTDIRRRIAEGRSVRHLVPPAIADEVVRLYHP